MIGGSVFIENKLNFPTKGFESLCKKHKVFRIGSNLSDYIDQKTSIEKIQSLAKTLSYFTVRDSWSAKLLKNKKLYHSDPVYSLDILDFLSKDETIEVNPKKLCASFSYPNKGFNYEWNVEEEISKLVEIIISKSEEENLDNISLLNFHDKRDDILNKSIKDKLHKINPTLKVEIVEYKGNIPRILREIYTSKYQICTRFHHIVLSNILEKEIYNFPYARKNLSHLADCKIEGRKWDKINRRKLINFKKSSISQFRVINTL